MFALKKSKPLRREREATFLDNPDPGPAAETDTQEHRLLLIEDEPGDVALAHEMLDGCMPDYHWRVLDKPSMAKALALLHDYKFDIALLDLSLQDMQGAETVDTLRMAAPDLPIVVYSGTHNRDTLKAALEKGAQFCIEKGSTMPKVVRAMIQCALAPEKF